VWIWHFFIQTLRIFTQKNHLFFNRTIQNIKNLNRAREIIQVLLKYGFEDIVINTPLKHLIPDSRKLTWLRKTKSIFEYSRWERIRLATEELGPAYIKFAQVLSNRPDVLPLPLIKELAKLQSQVPPFESSVVHQIIEKETGKTTDELFEYFLDSPIGSASIGQVHRAKFVDGDEVVVKVQRPNIRNTIETDLSIMHELASRTESYLEKNGITNILAVVETFEKTMQRELNYDIEARNMTQFEVFYKDKLNFTVPTVYAEYSTDKVLISQYISGCKITDKETILSWGHSPEELGEKLINIYLAQIFIHGMFHADPHPGNVLVQKNGKLALIDYGMVGSLMRKDKFAFAGIFVGLAQRDARKIATSLQQLAIEDNVLNKRAFEYAINEIIEDHLHANLKDSSITEVGTKLQQIIYENKMQIPSSVFLILRTLAILEGIGKQVHPGLNIYKLVSPFGSKMIQDQFSTENINEEILYRVMQFDELSRRLPSELTETLRKFRKGEFEVNLQHHNYESFLEKINSVTNRVIIALIMMTFIIASSIVMTNNNFANDVLTDEGYPYISVFGYFLAFLLSIGLFWNMWRSK